MIKYISYVVCCLIFYMWMNPPHLTAGKILESLLGGLLLEILIGIIFFIISIMIKIGTSKRSATK